jgi:chorismate mutase/prephenate dehydratase
VAALSEGPLPESGLKAIYREIMSAALSLEKTVKVAYLGPPSTFSHQAARTRFGGSVEYDSCETISDVFDAVEKRLADYGVVPVENSTEGAVTFTLDRLVETNLRICAEIYLPISQCLLSKAPRDQIKRLYSHPQVLGQCRQWLQRELGGVETIPTASTARAAEMASKDENAAALASRLASEIYGLSILEADVQDVSGNTTRFVVLARSYGRPTGDDKTSLLFAVQHKAGALYGALESFKRHSLSMTKIESRPSRNKAWEYFFFVDIEGHAEDERVASALKEMSEHCVLLTVLGSYPKALGL